MQLNEEETKLYELKVRREGYIEKKRQGMSATLHVRELTLLEQAIKAMDDRIMEQKIAVAKAQRALEAARIRLENAMKERKIQEKLREHALEEFKIEIEAEEQKEINELVTFRHGSKQERQE